MGTLPPCCKEYSLTAAFGIIYERYAYLVTQIPTPEYIQ